jgi:hypothetical protein
VKKVALMQPYLLPYIGYFQLISAVDTFVIYDDVQWMKGGWINRNRILVGGRPEWFTLSVKKGSLGTNINEREFSEKFDAEKQHVLEKMRAVYKGAPYFQQTMDLVERCFAGGGSSALVFISHVLRTCCEYLDLDTEIILSSDIDKTDGLRGQDRVIDISQKLGATEYVNAIGGRSLYAVEAFSDRGLVLSFVESQPTVYQQFGADFVADLSIVDVLMFNSLDDTKDLLGQFELV